MRAVKGWLVDADNWLFGLGSPVALGAFRMILGFLALCDLTSVLPQWTDWYGNHGYVPEGIGIGWLPPIDRGFSMFGQHLVLPFAVPRLNLLSGVTDDRISLAFYLLVVLAALTTTLGLWTRASTAILAVGIVTLHHRDPIILNGGDTLLRVMVLYLAIAPSGLACSLDRLIRLKRSGEASEPPEISVWPQRLIQINMAILYFTTVWLKWGGSHWRDGTATWYTARLGEFQRFPVPAFLNDFPAVYVTTYGTLAVELALATLVFFKPFRKWVLLAGLAMHGYIDYAMNIPFFSPLMVSTYVCFYSGQEVSDWGKRWKKRIRGWPVVGALAADPPNA